MTQLVIATPPAFSDTPEDLLVAGQPLRTTPTLAMLRNSKYGAVREEVIFMGFFQNGDTVPLAVSPVDGYTYSAEEITYRVMMYSTRAPEAGFTPGQTTRPVMDSDGTPGNLYWWTFDVDDATHVVATTVSYYVQDGAETPTNDGIVKVLAVCQRQSDNAFVGSPQGSIAGAAGTGISGLAPGATPVTPPSGGTYTIQQSDDQQGLFFSDSADTTVIIPPPSTWTDPDSFWFQVINEGSGTVTLDCSPLFFLLDDYFGPPLSTFDIGHNRSFTVYRLAFGSDNYGLAGTY